MPRIEDYLDALREGEARALHLREGAPPFWRVGTELLRHGDPLPEGDPFQAMILDLFRAARLEPPQDPAPADFTLCAAGGRFRAHVYRSCDGLNAVLHRIPDRVPALEGLDVPEALGAHLAAPSGLLLICGPARSGKSSILAALVDLFNRTEPRMIATVENPVEHIHTRGEAIVHQIGVGTHVPTCAAGIAAARAARADIIAVDGARDADAFREMIAAAEEGALVLGVLCAASVVDAIERVLECAPVEEVPWFRSGLASSLLAVLHQALHPARGGGLVAAVEFLTMTRTAELALREGRMEELAALVQGSRGHEGGPHAPVPAVHEIPRPRPHPEARR
ncbi:MAG: ATPase, T2SS/T4P/T4SS family [Planctomycetaceae bacterium]